jgi:hypothetical protein
MITHTLPPTDLTEKIVVPLITLAYWCDALPKLALQNSATRT